MVKDHGQELCGGEEYLVLIIIRCGIMSGLFYQVVIVMFSWIFFPCIFQQGKLGLFLVALIDILRLRLYAHNSTSKNC